MKRFPTIIASLFLTFVVSIETATAALIVCGNSYSVAAGTTVAAQFQVSNSVSAALAGIEGMIFTVQIASGVGTATTITSVDLLTSTVWNGLVSPGNITTPIGGSQLQYQSRDLFTDNPGDFIDANGLLATVTINTTDALPGKWIH